MMQPTLHEWLDKIGERSFVPFVSKPSKFDQTTKIAFSSVALVFADWTIQQKKSVVLYLSKKSIESVVYV